jgi:hypothetical protein
MASVEKILLTEGLLICVGSIHYGTVKIPAAYAALVHEDSESHCFCLVIIVPGASIPAALFQSGFDITSIVPAGRCPSPSFDTN